MKTASSQMGARLLCFGALVAVNVAAIAGQMVVTDSLPPPSSFEEYWDGSIAVVRGRVGASEQRMLGGTPVTGFAVQIAEVLRGPASMEVGQVITVTVPVGKMVVAGKTVESRAEGVEALQSNSEVVLFLERWPAAGTFGLRHGALGLYRVDQGEVGVARLAMHWPSAVNRKTLSSAEFLSMVREMKATRPAR